MAVVPRKRKTGLVYFVVNTWQKRQVSERVGTSKREAEIRDRAMKREIKAGEYLPPTERKSLTLGEYAEYWAKHRTNRSAEDERRHVRLYLMPRRWLVEKALDEVKARDVQKWVEELKDMRKADGTVRLSHKTISNSAAVLRRIYSQALREDRCVRQPVQLAPNTLNATGVEREPYTAAEAVIMMRHHQIAWPIRVLNAMCLLAGLRCGEACGRRWRDLDDASAPLACLTVSDQYDGQPLKTDRPRNVPVHPELASILREWAEEGFELYVGRKPKPDDFIVPSMGIRVERRGSCYTKHAYYAAFAKSLKLVDIRNRSLHSTRHTFITLARRGGARADVLERVTHNARRTMIDRYTHFDWAPLCEAVACLNLDAHPTVQRRSGSLGNSSASQIGVISTDSAELVQNPAEPPSRSPRAQANIPRLPASSRGSRQESGQESAKILGQLRERNLRRKRKLLTYQEVDPKAARPGLAVCRALDAVYDGDLDRAEKFLGEATKAMGGGS